jgi:nitroreductase
VEFFEVLETCRAIRYLRPDPVPQPIVDQLIWAATRAPSPGNTQGWDFIVVDQPAKLSTIGERIRSVIADVIESMPRPDRTTRLMLDGAANLARNFDQSPLVIFVGGPVIYPAWAPDEQFTWAATYAAAQNLLLAARALGLGATITILHQAADDLIRDKLSIPDDIRLAATIPVGWPAVSFGPVRRQPIDDVVHYNGWRGSKRVPATD